MCKHVVLVPMMHPADTAMQKSCKPVMLGRMWQASRRALSLEHSPPHHFACSQWQKGHSPATAYLIYRWLLLVAVVSMAMSSFAGQKLPRRYEGPKVELNYFKWFIYFTNWGCIMLVVQSVLALAVVHRFRKEKSYNPQKSSEQSKAMESSLDLGENETMSVDPLEGVQERPRSYAELQNVSPRLTMTVTKMTRFQTYWNTHLSKGEEDEISMPMSKRTRTPFLCRLYWLAHNIATDLAFVITLVYWTMVHDPKIHDVNFFNLLVHGGNSVVMLCELVVTAHPFRAAHALYGAGTGLAYGVFSAFYWSVGGTDRLGQPAIYPSLDWNKPGSAIAFVGMCAVVMICAHIIATCIAAVRLRIAGQTQRSDRFTLPTH